MSLLPLETEIDWATKRVRGYMLIVAGFVIAIPVAGYIVITNATFRSSNSFETAAIVPVAFFVVGVWLMWYGNQLVEKAKHVAWTKEALREHEQAKTRIEKELNRELISNETMSQQSLRPCKSCGAPIFTSTIWCPVCKRSQV